jgi:hypothetical protein
MTEETRKFLEVVAHTLRTERLFLAEALTDRALQEKHGIINPLKKLTKAHLQLMAVEAVLADIQDKED